MLEHQGHLITTISDEDMTMTDKQDTRELIDLKPVGAQFVRLCEAYQALQTLMDVHHPAATLLSVLNDDFRAVLDDADQLGLLP